VHPTFFSVGLPPNPVGQNAIFPPPPEVWFSPSAFLRLTPTPAICSRDRFLKRFFFSPGSPQKVRRVNPCPPVGSPPPHEFQPDNILTVTLPPPVVLELAILPIRGLDDTPPPPPRSHSPFRTCSPCSSCSFFFPRSSTPNVEPPISPFTQEGWAFCAKVAFFSSSRGDLPGPPPPPPLPLPHAMTSR